FGIQLWSSARVTSLGVICLANDEIFAGLARIGYEKPSTKLTFYKAFFSSQWKFFIHTILHSLSAKRTSCNEFSSVMASALICLSSGQRFNFSKYIFESLVQNVDSTSKFYMYPRFIQVIIQSNIADLSKHTNRYISPVLTQKVFANMRRVRKGFSGVETPLFENMLVARAVDAEEEVQVPAQDDVVLEHVAEEIADDVVLPTPTSPLPSSPVLDKCSALVLRVEGLETANAAQQLEIIKLKARVKKLERLNKVKSSKLRRLKKVGTFQRIESSDDVETVFNQGRISVDIETNEGIELEVAAASASIPAAKPKILKIAAAAPALNKEKKRSSYKQIDWNAAFDHVQAKETQYIKRYHGFKKKPQSKSEARKNMISYLKNTEGYKMEFFKGLKYDDILLIFQARFDANLKFLFKTREEMEKEDEEIIKSINETPAHKAAKTRRLNEQAKEDEALKKQLEVVVDEDDDVFIEATPISRKVPVVNYEIVMINIRFVWSKRHEIWMWKSSKENNSRPVTVYKIIRADDTHQLYTSFITLLKNFDREDLEDLWKIMKARFSTSKPTNFSDDYLLSTLKTMFEKTDGQDVIWRSQQTEYGQALVKSWKLLTTYGVHIISLTTTMFVLLVEKRYPLSRFTLEQLVNVARLQVEEESEMSLELLRFTRQQLLEYQQQ
nr:hypothetical protein [Tanacetum cinerariifolium]